MATLNKKKVNVKELQDSSNLTNFNKFKEIVQTI